MARKLTNLDMMLFTPQWFLTLFAKTLSANSFFRILDSLLFEGSKTLYRVGLTLLVELGNQLKNKLDI